MVALITTYGYFAVLLGTFLEGETILVLAGFAAHRGYLELPWVIAAAAAGTIASDQLFFYLGRFRGAAWLERRPVWKARADRAFRLVARNETLIILGFRFVYGLRTVTPVVLGVSRVRPGKYIALNIIGAVAWAIAFGLVGYLAGAAAERALGDLRRAEMGLFALIMVVGLVTWLWHWRRDRREAGLR
jgi:membrane protein DedA with SNARE-associated domain